MLVSSVKSVPSIVTGSGDIIAGAVAHGCGQLFCGVTCCAVTAYVGHVACEGTGVGFQKGEDGSVKMFVDYQLRSSSEMRAQVQEDVKSIKAMITRQGDVGGTELKQPDSQESADTGDEADNAEVKADKKTG